MQASAYRIRKQPCKRDQLATRSVDRGCREGASLARADKLFGPSQLVAPQWSGTWRDPQQSHCQRASSLVTTHYIYLSSAYTDPLSSARASACHPLASGTWRNLQQLRHYGNTRARRRLAGSSRARIALIRLSLPKWIIFHKIIRCVEEFSFQLTPGWRPGEKPRA